jgi:hypothetical protein
MIWEIVILVVLGGAFVVLKVLHSENERKRRLERAERNLRVKAATGGFAPKKWDEPESGNDESEGDEDEQEGPEEDEESDSEGSEEKDKED